MGYGKDRAPRDIDKITQNPKHLVGGLGIQRAGRFVGQDQHRIVGQRPCNGNALALAARELVGRLSIWPSRPSEASRVAGALLLLLRGELAEPAHGQHHILPGGEFGQQKMKLEDKPEFGQSDPRALIGGHVVRCLPLTSTSPLVGMSRSPRR
jgi:hypothetical protein